MTDTTLQIEVAYAEPRRAIVKIFRLPPDSRVADAVRLAALEPDFSGVDLQNAALGIFGRAVSIDQPLKDGDRIEIYRPLAADPKLARRARVKQARKRSG